MRNATLQALLYEFTADSATQFTAATDGGAEVPFEVIETDDGRSPVPLYCYRPLTGSFIRERLGLLSHLPSYTAASRGLADIDGTELYLRQRGEHQIPPPGRDRADAVLRVFLSRVFEERSEFGLDGARFALAFEELETALYAGSCVTIVIAPLLGIALDPGTSELPLGDGLSLVPGSAIADAPTEAVWAGGRPPARGEPQTAEQNVLLVLTTTHERASSRAGAVALQARVRFRRVLTALRLFERGSYALGPTFWARTDAGSWWPLPVPTCGRVGVNRLTLIPAGQEDELRAFCNLIARRMGGWAGLSGRGEIAWALGRFELGCERTTPFVALTDYLLALRALLEPEGPGSGRLAQRLAVICAAPEGRQALADRVVRAIALERAVIAGLPTDTGDPEALVDELGEHLRALLRDAICGHLDSDLVAVADGLLSEAAAAVQLS